MSTSPLAGALARYRVMAFVTGSFLIILTLVTLAKYGGAAWGWEDEAFLSIATWIGIVHGWIYMAYVATCVDVWLRMKWRLPRLALMALGGVVPGLSFVTERKVSREVAASLSA